MYHPTRGGVRGGQDQFKWDDVKVDKHRENYLGHSIMAPVGRWQKGKDLHWYAKDKKAAALDAEAAKEEIRRIKEEEEQAMREALGLAPKRAARPQGNRLDKHEYSELVKRSSTAEDLGAGHAEAAQVQGLGLYKGHQTLGQSSSLPVMPSDPPSNPDIRDPIAAFGPRLPQEAHNKEDEESKEKRRREEKRREKEKRHERREKRRSHDSEDKQQHGRDKKRRHHSRSD